MWDFVRACAAHPDLKGSSAEEALELIRKARVRSGYKLVLWSQMFPESDDPDVEFLATWDSIRIPAGQDILGLAVALAKEKPLKLLKPISAKYSELLSIAYRLQILRPDDHICLPVLRLGEALHVSPRMVSFYTKQARRSGYLILLRKHHQPSGNAAKYAFACERFDSETREEIAPSNKNPHFHKDYEELKDSEDCEGSDDSRETSRIVKESERQEGPSGLKGKKDGNLGNSRVESVLKPTTNTDTRKLLQTQITFLHKKHGTH
jgi:hypothetical protein